MSTWFSKAKKVMSELTAEEFDKLFPDWKILRDTHILSGMDVEASWRWFVEELANKMKEASKGGKNG